MIHMIKDIEQAKELIKDEIEDVFDKNIDDKVTDIADSSVDVYNQDLWNWFKENFWEIYQDFEETIKDYFSKDFDFFKAIKFTQYELNKRLLYDAIAQIKEDIQYDDD